MNTRKILTLAALMSAGALAGNAAAGEYNTLQADRSQVGFTYQQMGVSMDGHFQRFSAQLGFDPARPAAARVSFDVDLASIDVGNPDGNSEVAGKLWFNTRSFPTAHFAATAVKPLGGNRYQVAGRLTIKGRTQDLVIPASVTPQGTSAVFDGSFPIRRADFAIGEGEWADFGTVANEITVRFHLLASAGK